MAAAAADPSYYNHLALHIRPSQPLQYNPFFRSFVPFSALLPHSSSSSSSKSIEGV